MKRLLSIMLTGCMLFSLTTTALAASFTDVADTHWSYEYVEKAYSNGLVNGTGGGQFAPDASVSNAEWATMVCNLFHSDSIEAFLANGGKNDAWWMPYMYVGQMFLSGTTVMQDGWLSPGWEESVVLSEISRYDMAQVIYNVAKSQKWDKPDTDAISSQIPDWSSVPEKYQEAVAYCFAAGFVTGADAKGTFHGAESMTRGAAAVVLCRMLDAKNGEHSFGTVTGNENSGSNQSSTDQTAGAATVLANGKPVTDENIAEILEEYRQLYPEGTAWGQERSYVSDTFRWGLACDAWAFMISDALWGEAKYTTHHDISSVKTGDIIYLRDNETYSGHWCVVIGTDSFEDGVSYFITCEGNVNGIVVWDVRRYVQNTTMSYPDSTIYSFYK